MEFEKTIAAIATATGGGVGMVRLSGPQALAVAGRVFRPMNPAKFPETMPGYTGAFGRVCHGEQLLDEAVLFVYHAPHSYTGEDVAEFCCHGGEFVLSQVLAAVIAAGARPAEAGEYTRRALMNGRMTLTEAESVIDILAAQNTQSLRAALGAMEGALHREVLAAADTLTDCCAHISAWIDYPEEDVPELSDEHLLKTLDGQKAELDSLIRGYGAGAVLRRGVDCVLLGRPNVGKSTLLNLMAGFDRAIVTPVAGTTRDIVEQAVQLGEIRLNLFDTAGVRDVGADGDAIEAEGIRRSWKKLDEAGLVLAVFDAAQPLTDADLEIAHRCQNRPALAILNKEDLADSTENATQTLQPYFKKVITLCAKEADSLQPLTDAVAELLGTAQLDPGAAQLCSARQLAAATRARDAIAEAMKARQAGFGLDATGICLTDALQALCDLTGEDASDATIEEVFETFCVGK